MGILISFYLLVLPWASAADAGERPTVTIHFDRDGDLNDDPEEQDRLSIKPMRPPYPASVEDYDLCLSELGPGLTRYLGTIPNALEDRLLLETKRYLAIFYIAKVLDYEVFKGAVDYRLAERSALQFGLPHAPEYRVNYAMELLKNRAIRAAGRNPDDLSLSSAEAYALLRANYKEDFGIVDWEEPITHGPGAISYEEMRSRQGSLLQPSNPDAWTKIWPSIVLDLRQPLPNEERELRVLVFKELDRYYHSVARAKKLTQLAGKSMRKEPTPKEIATYFKDHPDEFAEVTSLRLVEMVFDLTDIDETRREVAANELLTQLRAFSLTQGRRLAEGEQIPFDKPAGEDISLNSDWVNTRSVFVEGLAQHFKEALLKFDPIQDVIPSLDSEEIERVVQIKPVAEVVGPHGLQPTPLLSFLSTMPLSMDLVENIDVARDTLAKGKVRFFLLVDRKKRAGEFNEATQSAIRNKLGNPLDYAGLEQRQVKRVLEDLFLGSRYRLELHGDPSAVPPELLEALSREKPSTRTLLLKTPEPSPEEIIELVLEDFPYYFNFIYQIDVEPESSRTGPDDR